MVKFQPARDGVSKLYFHHSFYSFVPEFSSGQVVVPSRNQQMQAAAASQARSAPMSLVNPVCKRAHGYRDPDSRQYARQHVHQVQHQRHGKHVHQVQHQHHGISIH